MKNLLIGLLTTFLFFSSCQQDFLTQGEIDKQVCVEIEPAKDTFKFEKSFDVVFTTYKVNEAKYNPTRYLADNTKVNDMYDVPDVVSFSAKHEEMFQTELGEEFIIEINGKFYRKRFRDRMSNKEKYAGRVDLLINKDSPHWKLKGKIHKIKRI